MASEENPVTAEPSQDHLHVGGLAYDPDEDKQRLLNDEEGGDDAYVPNGLTPEEYAVWSGYALRIAFISLTYSTGVMILALTASLAMDSATLLSMAVEAAADGIGDALVIWRFSGDQMDPTIESYDNQASVMIAFVMMGSCLFVSATAIRMLTHGHHQHHRTWVLWAHFGVALCSTVLTIGKVVIARKVKSRVLMLDACTGGIVALIGFMYFFLSQLKESHPHLWWMDSSFAIVASVFIFVVALHTLCSHNYADPAFWTLIPQTTRRSARGGGISRRGSKESLTQHADMGTQHSSPNDNTPKWGNEVHAPVDPPIKLDRSKSF